MDVELNQALYETAATALARNKERVAVRSFVHSYLRSNKLVEFPTEADGNCAEHAVTALLRAEGDTRMQRDPKIGWLRELVGRELLENGGMTYSQFLSAGETVETISSQIKKDGVFFDSISLKATSLKYSSKTNRSDFITPDGLSDSYS